MGTRKLSDIVKTIYGGQIVQRITAREDEQSVLEMLVLVPKAINNGTLLRENLVLQKLKSIPDSKRVTKKGDIVIKLSTPYDACYIDENNEGLLVPSYCAILNDFNEQCDCNYLLAYINSKLYRDQVSSLIAGMTIGVLSTGMIKNIDVLYPEKNKRIEIGNLFSKQLKRIDVVNRIIALENEKISSMFYELDGE